MSNPTTATATNGIKITSMRTRVKSAPAPPAPTPAEKRLLDQHVTAYPSLLNAEQLPPRALQEDDFSEIDPLAYRRHHPIANNNAGTFDAANQNGGEEGEGFTARPVQLMTTKQLASKMTQLGTALRAGDDPSLSAPGRRGVATKNYTPPFDGRSTYRADYCQDEIPPLRDGAARRAQRLSTYQDQWTEEERADIEASMRRPYLTLPESLRRGRARPTYRCDYMRGADDHEAVRSQRHTVDLQQMGTTFAYSGYSIDDPRRTINYDANIAALEEPHNALEQSRRAQVQQQQQQVLSASRGGAVGVAGGRSGSFAGTGGSSSLIQKYRRHTTTDNGGSTTSPSFGGSYSAREELDALRALRRESFERTQEVQRRRSATAETAVDIADRCSHPLVVPGVKGGGYRRAPQSNQEGYIYLPQDHFRRCEVTDY